MNTSPTCRIGPRVPSCLPSSLCVHIQLGGNSLQAANGSGPIIPFRLDHGKSRNRHLSVAGKEYLFPFGGACQASAPSYRLFGSRYAGRASALARQLRNLTGVKSESLTARAMGYRQVRTSLAIGRCNSHWNGQPPLLPPHALDARHGCRTRSVVVGDLAEERPERQVIRIMAIALRSAECAAKSSGCTSSMNCCSYNPECHRSKDCASMGNNVSVRLTLGAAKKMGG